MSRQRFTAEFKAEAIKQTTERGYSVKDVSERSGLSDTSLDKCGSGNIIR